nr:MAG TPA: hypothetical protein [Caudoviricetes sp.]
MGSKVTENIVMCRLGYYVLLAHNVKIIQQMLCYGYKITRCRLVSHHAEII